MLRPLLLALAGIALAGLLALGVFFASEAALGEDDPVLGPAIVSTTGRTTTERATTSTATTTEDGRTVPTIRTQTDEDGGRGRGRGRGRSGGSDNSGPGGGGGSGDD